ncbi:MAG: exodeoxyribonuclease VII large subunit [Candidatus Dormibacteria bacterium]
MPADGAGVPERARVVGVAELTALVKGAINRRPELEDILVEGEVSNLSAPRSGHLYFSLKDRNASVRCVCFRIQAQRIPFHPEDGMVVVAHGRVDVFEAQGSYQLYVDRLEPSGVGALALAVEQTRRRLAAEGLFDEALKRAPAWLPRRVAVVTSSSGAAVRDVCTVLARRAPSVDVVVVSTPVQGDGAAAALANALARAQRVRGVETILLVRGGGSYEDLAAFQDEALARAIRASRIAVVTGIGHETDTTIADWAADRRAATPSAAAELAAPDTHRLRDDVVARSLRLGLAVRQGVAGKRAQLEHSTARLDRVAPSRRLPELRQALDARAGMLRGALLRELSLKRRVLQSAGSRLALLAPQRRLPLERAALAARRQQLDVAWATHAGVRRSRVAVARGRLEALSPARVLERGFSITLDAATGRIVQNPAAAPVGTRLRTRLSGGELLSRVDGAGSGSTGAVERLYDG